MNSSWYVRRARPEDRAQILLLLETQMGVPNPSEHVRWFYDNNPAGKALVWVAEERSTSRIIGMNGFFPWRISVRGRDVLGSQNADLVVIPEYRRQGVFLALGQLAIGQELRECGVQLVFGFPNEAALPGHKRLGCMDIGALRSLVIPIDTEWIAQTLFKSKGLACLVGKSLRLLRRCRRFRPSQVKDTSIKCALAERFDERFDPFLRAIGNIRPIQPKRTIRYLNWRYSERPGRSYRVLTAESSNGIEGYTVLNSKGRVLYINELMTSRRSAEAALVENVVEYAERGGFALVHYQAMTGHPCFERFQNYGFWQVPTRRSLPRFIVYRVYHEIPHFLLRNPENWLITRGDQDTA